MNKTEHTGKRGKPEKWAGAARGDVAGEPGGVASRARRAPASAGVRYDDVALSTYVKRPSLSRLSLSLAGAVVPMAAAGARRSSSECEPPILARAVGRGASATCLWLACYGYGGCPFSQSAAFCVLVETRSFILKGAAKPFCY